MNLNWHLTGQLGASCKFIKSLRCSLRRNARERHLQGQCSETAAFHFLSFIMLSASITYQGVADVMMNDKK